MKANRIVIESMVTSDSERRWIAISWPLDTAKYHESWVTKEIVPGVTLFTYEDGTPIKLECLLENKPLILEEI